jgi:hypothetical protein
MHRERNVFPRKIWLLKLVPSFRYSRILTGVVMLSLLFPFFYLGAKDVTEHKTPALFFSLIIAYIIPMFSFITSKAQENLRALRPILDLDKEGYERAQAQLFEASPVSSIGWLFLGAAAGFAHMSFVRGSITLAFDTMFAGITGFLSTLGALAVWVIMSTVVSMLIKQAMLFARLGGHNTRVSLLDACNLLPFARVSISSSLALIGALALFPLISIKNGLDLAYILPGAIAILVPLMTIFIIPVWPIHRRLSELKQRELADLNKRIAASLNADGSVDIEAEKLDTLLPLLNYRREIIQISSWPFDLGNITRFALYLIIPPLTWVGAALIENMVDAFL